MKDNLKDRTWFSRPKATGDPFDIQIYLVNAPLTFGHSQLIASFSGDPNSPHCDETTRFSLIVPYIGMALKTFQQAFGTTMIHRRIDFAPLAKLTMTDGDYIKTLILRASANEKKTEYKVHLVPYFTSHASACKNRFTAIHSVNPEKTGGLLGWLGMRETIADSWLIDGDNPFKERLDDVVEKVLGLPCLKGLLVKEMPPQAEQGAPANGFQPPLT
jgi:hypothetical protein